MRCRVCGYKAIYKKRRFCKKHLLNYIEKKVKKFLTKHNLKNVKILIPISGGKDSAVLTYILSRLEKEFSLKINLLHLNLGINEFSKESEIKVKELAKLIGKEVKIIKTVSIEKIKKLINNKPCSYCGTIKRYLINKYAYEKDYDYVATGHNLDDEIFFAINNLKNRHIEYFLRSNEITETNNEKKVVGRIKPLHLVSEEEIKLYADIKNLPYLSLRCKFSDDKQKKEKEKIDILFSIEEKVNFLKSLRELKKNKNINKEEVKKCIICGYPTTKDTCRYCRIIRLINGK